MSDRVRPTLHEKCALVFDRSFGRAAGDGGGGADKSNITRIKVKWRGKN